jgi:acetolactate decarboxylase
MKNITKQSIYQTGTINSLLQAVYDGDASMEKLSQHGDFGLGALDAIDGELIICDGKFFRADARGQINQLAPETCSPFAVITKFTSEHSFEITASSFAELEQKLLPQLISANLIYAIRIKALFNHIELRSEECTCRPYRKLVEILPDLQRTFSVDNIRGTLVGVWFPNYLAQVNVPGFHFHFIDEQQQVGGHVFGLKMEHGKVEIQTLHGFELDLIQSDEFYQANLDINNGAAVAQVEQVRI